MWNRLCGIFGAGGGFVFNTVHNVQANVPVKNVFALMNAVCELRIENYELFIL